MGGATLNHMNHDMVEVNGSDPQMLPFSARKSLGTKLTCSVQPAHEGF